MTTMAGQGTPSAQYSVTIRLEYPHESGWIAKIASVVSRQRGTIGAIDLVQIHKGKSLRDYTIECASTDQAEKIIQSVGKIEGVKVRSVSDNTFLMHLGGEVGDCLQSFAQDASRPFHGIHARCSASLYGDSQRSTDLL